MLASDKHRLRTIAIKARLRAIEATDELTPELRTESEGLVTELTDVETRESAALATEGSTGTETTTEGLDAAARECIELRGRSTLGAFLLAALQGRVPSGAEAEYAAAHNAPPGHVPLDLFESGRPAVEHRAATPAPTTGAGVTVAPVQPFVFAPSIAPRLGIDMPSVGSGGFSEMTVTTSVPAGAVAKGGDASDTAGALTAVTANPRRISARLTLTIEDIASIGVGNFESALRQNVSMKLSSEYDDQAINGNGTSPNVSGLIAQLTDPTNPTAIAGFDDMVAAFADSIDGLWASTIAEVAIVANVDAYKLSAKTFRDRVIDTGQRGGVSLGDMTFASYAEKMTGGWWTNKRMPATASTIARAIVYRKGQMGLRTACHPTWGTLSIDDRFSDSRSGQTHFTVHVLVGDRVLITQPAAYSMVEFKVA